MSVFLALMLQVGPAPVIQPISPVPDELYELRRRNREAEDRQDAPSVADSKLTNCIALIDMNPEAAHTDASRWLDRAPLEQKASASQCLGMALIRLQRWEEAAIAFTQGRDTTIPAAQMQRAQLGAMAGNALLGAGRPGDAQAALERAQADAASAGNILLGGEIAIDRARALVALGRDEDAKQALAAARTSAPDNPQAWLFSATLARRMGDLVAAQEQIQTAARLAPTDPEVGLEAGVIAALAGNDEAARKSWDSVVAMAPDTQLAATAKSYLAQLDGP